MTIDKAKLKALAETGAANGNWLECSATDVLALLAEIERLETQVRLAGVAAEVTVRQEVGRAVTRELVLAHERDQLKAENEDYKSGQDRYEQIIEDLKAENEQLRKSMKEMCAMYTHVWDREDGALVCFSKNVERFDKAHEEAWSLLTGKEASHDR